MVGAAAAEPLRPLPAGHSHGLLTRAAVRAITRTRDETRGDTQRLPRYRARLERLKIYQITRMPSSEAHAEVGDAEMISSLTYRFNIFFSVRSDSLATSSRMRSASSSS
jgi:hypothetical protein